MNVLKPTKTEWISFFILMPLLNIITLHIMFGDSIWNKFTVLLAIFCINCILGLVTFLLNVFVMHKFQQLMPDLKQTVKRVIFIVLSHIIITIIIFGIGFNVYDAASLFGFKKRYTSA